MDDLTAAGKLLAQSGMFGISKEADGFVIAATCHQQGMSLLEFRETYHIIHGTPSMRTDTMLARLVDHGGEYEILSRTPDRAAIRAACGKASGEFELTWEQAQLEPFVYAGKEGDVVAALASGQRPPLKDKYATPRSRMQMIWARVVSDAVRAVCPQACKGTYTPEEVSDYAQPAQARRGTDAGAGRGARDRCRARGGWREQMAGPCKPEHRRAARALRQARDDRRGTRRDRGRSKEEELTCLPQWTLKRRRTPT